MREHEINKLNNFIAGWYLDDTSICDKLIEHHKNSHDKVEGKSSYGIDTNAKDSTDVYLYMTDESLWDEYCLENLQKVTNLYRQKYPLCDDGAVWSITESINIQHYNPHQGFHAWHTERSSAIHPFRDRHLVFMTYLNDVTDGGETEFLHQKVRVKPEKGLTLIWPVDWTFTHRGVTSPTQEKYITTGWYSYIPPNQCG